MKRKYSFLDKEVAEQKIKALYDKYKSEEDAEFVLEKRSKTIGGHTIVYLGRLVKEDAVYDLEGRLVTEAVLYDDYAVDCIWRVKKDEVVYDEEGEVIETIKAVQDYEGWEEFEIEVSKPKHGFC